MLETKTAKAFTLIEILIVIAIIGILSVALVPIGMKALQKGRDATRISHVDAIVKATKEYFIDGRLATGLGTTFNTRVILGNSFAKPSQSFLKYLPVNLPKDPSGVHSFYIEGNTQYTTMIGDYLVVVFKDNQEFAVCSYVEVPGNANVEKTTDNKSKPGMFSEVSPIEFSKDYTSKVNYYCVKQKAA